MGAMVAVAITAMARGDGGGGGHDGGGHYGATPSAPQAPGRCGRCGPSSSTASPSSSGSVISMLSLGCADRVRRCLIATPIVGRLRVARSPSLCAAAAAIELRGWQRSWADRFPPNHAHAQGKPGGISLTPGRLPLVNSAFGRPSSSGSLAMLLAILHGICRLCRSIRWNQRQLHAGHRSH